MYAIAWSDAADMKVVQNFKIFGGMQLPIESCAIL